MTATPTQACYWIVGARNNGQAPAVAVDLHDADSGLIGETWTKSLPRKGCRTAALKIATRYAARCGVTPSKVYYDKDSTQFFADA